MAAEGGVTITSDGDVIEARQVGRTLAEAIGFSASELTTIATAISEVARNIVAYAEKGEVVVSLLEDGGRRGIAVVAKDSGPGIPDLELALQDGFSTGNSLGIGLPGARRLMDEFEITSDEGRGTIVSMKKWLR